MNCKHFWRRKSKTGLCGSCAKRKWLDIFSKIAATGFKPGGVVMDDIQEQDRQKLEVLRQGMVPRPSMTEHQEFYCTKRKRES